MSQRLAWSSVPAGPHLQVSLGDRAVEQQKDLVGHFGPVRAVLVHQPEEMVAERTFIVVDQRMDLAASSAGWRLA